QAEDGIRDFHVTGVQTCALPISQMLRERAALFGHVAEGYWRDIGNIEEYRRAHDDILRGRVKIRLRGERRTTGRCTIWGARGAMIGREGRCRGTVLLGANVAVGAGAALANVIIGPGTKLGPRADVRGTALWEDRRVRPSARICEAVCGTGVKIGAGAAIRERTIVADNAEVGARAVVGPNVKVWPDKVVEERAALTHSLIWGEAWERSLFTGAR